MIRRRFLMGIAAGGVTAVLATGGTVMALRSEEDGTDGADGADGSSAEDAVGATAQVTRRDLAETAEFAGTLGYGDQTDVSLAAEGTITALPELGTVVDRGQTMVEVDGLPIPLLFGARPLWRPLSEGVDDGVDIQDLEANLVALGFASSSTLTVDQAWTAATTTAVKKWQASLGWEETGVVSPGDAVVLPRAARLAELPTPVGSPAAGVVAKVTATTRVVTVALDATKQSLVTVAQAVEVDLPDGSTTTGTVAEVGRVAEAEDSDDGSAPGQDTGSTIDVVVALDDPAVGASLDEAPVTVRIVTSAAQGVLAVPVEALLALAEGGYAVELVEPGGTTRLVTVETGAFADGWVEVTSVELAEGDEVEVPS